MKFEKRSHCFRPKILKSMCTKFQSNPTIEISGGGAQAISQYSLFFKT